MERWSTLLCLWASLIKLQNLIKTSKMTLKGQKQLLTSTLENSNNSQKNTNIWKVSKTKIKRYFLNNGYFLNTKNKLNCNQKPINKLKFLCVGRLKKKQCIKISKLKTKEIGTEANAEPILMEVTSTVHKIKMDRICDVQMQSSASLLIFLRLCLIHLSLRLVHWRKNMLWNMNSSKRQNLARSLQCLVIFQALKPWLKRSLLRSLKTIGNVQNKQNGKTEKYLNGRVVKKVKAKTRVTNKM